MALNRNRLYSIIFMACIVGYIWLFFGLNSIKTKKETFDVCLIKQSLNIPCPSCGSTRSIIAITKGNFDEALKINPLGVIIAGIIIFAPIWILFDISTKKETLFKFYIKIETYLNRPQYAIPLILLVIINWIWNITKGL